MFLTTRWRVASIAVIGRPNVGKSLLRDALIGEGRAIISGAPGAASGTMDTAGARKQPEEHYSRLCSLNAVALCDIALLVFDAMTGVTSQDRRLAGLVIDEGKGLIFVGNKGDLVDEHGEFSQAELANAIHDLIPFACFAPITFLSANTGRWLDSVVPVVDHVAENLDRRIPAAQLTAVVRDAILAHPVPSIAGRLLNIYHVSQPGTRPPVFVFRCNDPELIQPDDRRFLENVIRQHFDFKGVPLTLEFSRERHLTLLWGRGSASALSQ